MSKDKKEPEYDSIGDAQKAMGESARQMAHSLNAIDKLTRRLHERIRQGVERQEAERRNQERGQRERDMTTPRWEEEAIGDGEMMLISSLNSGDRLIDLSVVQRGAGGDFEYDVVDGAQVVHRGYEQTLPAAQTAAENHARRQLTKCVSGCR